MGEKKGVRVLKQTNLVNAALSLANHQVVGFVTLKQFWPSDLYFFLYKANTSECQYIKMYMALIDKRLYTLKIYYSVDLLQHDIFLMLAHLRRSSFFDHHLWSIFQSSLYTCYKLQFFTCSEGSYVSTILVFTIQTRTVLSFCCSICEFQTYLKGKID